VERDGTALRRWTSGDAMLKLPQPVLDGPTMLEIRADNGGMAYVTNAEAPFGAVQTRLESRIA
jgi:hypothetical protein